VRLDLRYVENWSLMLDVQIIWKTWSAIVHRAGPTSGWYGYRSG
jgi:lipopolysaccharide/colanic/teichoic acid biosynthesis glycosyltransferase